MIRGSYEGPRQDLLHLQPGVSSFLLTSRDDAASIIEQQRKTRVSTLQLVDTVPLETYRDLRREPAGIALVQVVHVRALRRSKRLTESPYTSTQFSLILEILPLPSKS